MCLPALRALKDGLPDAEIFIAAKKYLTSVYLHLPEIKEILPLPDDSSLKNTFQAAKNLREYDFDAGILFTNSFNTALLFKLAKIKRRLGYDKDMRGFLLTDKLPYPTANANHHIYFYTDLVAKFLDNTPGQDGVQDKTYSEALVITEQEKENARKRLKEWGVNGTGALIGISPSAAYGTAKQWLPERFGALMERLIESDSTAEILLLGSGNEREKIGSIMDNMRGTDGRVFNLAGKLSLREALAAISLCHSFVSNDSGLMHAASSLRVPLVAIFGPTEPHKTAPLTLFNPNIKLLHHPFECAPCKDRDCRIDHRCMKAVTVDEVWQALESLRHTDA